MRRARATLLAVVVWAAACAPTIMSTAPPGGPTPVQMAEFWSEPSDLATRDLLAGPWGLEVAPDPAAPYTFVAKKKRGLLGYSPGYTVKDPKEVEWSAKQADESQSEVTASRLVWALGYHQPPVYYLESWTLVGGDRPGPQTRARFRPERPDLLKKVGEWSWHANPFVGTQPYRGLLVMMVMLNNSDLKRSQNTIYDLRQAREGTRRFWVARDLGHSFGETGIWKADRNDIVEFETEKFILGVRRGRVRFNWSGRYGELLKDLTPADVRWTSERLSHLSDKQWADAFRAGGYDPELAQRFIKRFREKIAEGLRLSE